MDVFDPYIGFKVVQVLNSARTVDELDFAITIVNKSYPILRGQIEIMEVLKNGESKVVKKDHINFVQRTD